VRSLSDREREVVWGLAAGRRAAEIAARLNISIHTVRSHVRKAMAKTGARSQPHLVAITVASHCDCVDRIFDRVPVRLDDCSPRSSASDRRQSR
jgi:DNA-binding CsgD family transcriptional regulator